MPYPEEAILPVVEELKQHYYYENSQQAITATADYLTGKIFPVPVYDDKTIAAHLGSFIRLLKIPELWDDNDRLLLQLIGQPAAWESVKETFYTHIIRMLDAPATSASIVLRFSYFTSYLQQRGLTPGEIGSVLIMHATDGFGNYDLSPLKFSPTRKFLQDLLRNAEPYAINAYLARWQRLPWNSLFFRLLIKAAPELENNYLEKIILQKEQARCFHYALATTLLKSNAGKYEPFIRQMTEQGATAVQLSGYQVLHAFTPEAYQPLLLRTAQHYLDENTGAIDTFQGYRTVLPEPAMPLPLSVIAISALLNGHQSAAIRHVQECLDEKRYLHKEVFRELADALHEKALPMLLSALAQDYDAKVLLPLMDRFDPSLFIEQLWPYTLHKLKSVRTLVAVILAKDPQALAKAGELLLHKKAEQRTTAVQILCAINNNEAHKLLHTTLQQEVNDDARDLMMETLGYPVTDTPEALVTAAKKRGKLSRPIEKWLDDTALPSLYHLDGSTFTFEMVRFLIYRMSRVKALHSDPEAKTLLQLVDRSRSGDFAAHLFQVFLDNGGDAKLKYLLALAALTGDETFAIHLHLSINQWIEDKRLKLAELGVGALAIHGSNEALRAVDWYARRYRTRKVNVGAAALVALQQAATELGISAHELGDRIVPDFGFKGLYRNFEVKGDIYRASVDNHFRLSFFNDRGRQLKAMPATTSDAVKRFFKSVQKEIAEVVRTQSARLEHLLVIQRTWRAAQWEQFFLRNPVMFVFANRLLWALYDEEGELVTSFRCASDGQLLHLQGEALTLPEQATIRLLHPLCLDADTLLQWQQQNHALGILPVFPQLERPVAVVAPGEASAVSDFEDTVMEQQHLSTHLEQRGWKLSTDGNYTYAWHKADDEHQLDAVMELSSIYREAGIHYKLGKLYFADRSKQGQRLPLHQVPRVFYSEAFNDIAVLRGKMELAQDY